MPNPTSHDFAAIEAQMNALAESQRAAFSTPRHPPKLLSGALAVPRTTLTGWLTLKVFDLDADKNREPGAHRLFSTRDCIMLAAANEFVSVGVSLPFARETAGRICDGIMSMMGRPMGFMPSDLSLVIYRREGEWRVVREGAVPMDAPPLTIRFDTLNFVSRVSRALGIPFSYGTADDLRRAADELDRNENKNGDD